MKKIYILILLLSLTVVFIPGCKANFGKADPDDKKKDAVEAPVETVKAVRGPISSYVSASTTIKAENNVNIHAEISEKIISVLVEEGDRVAKGQTLAVFDDSELKLVAEKARINYEKQKSDYERFASMKEKSLISSEQYDTASFAENQARLDMEQAMLNLSRSRIKATISGVVSARFISEGDRITMGAPAFSIVDLDHLTAEAFLPEKTIGSIMPGQNVIVGNESVSDGEVTAVISRINPVVDPQTGTVKVTTEITGGSGNLRPGMFVELRIVTDTRGNALLVPKKALIFENENDYLFVVKDGKAKKIDISTGFQGADVIEVIAGVEENDEVIVAGNNGLKDNAPVKIINPKN